MAEFKDIAREFNRMCHFYDTPPCEGCPMGFHTINRSDCMSRLFYNPEKYEERVIKWAEKHPEPKYPTWTEWLSKQGFVELKAGQFVKQTGNEYVYECKTVAILTDKAAVPIPADIAEKLGVEQMEV